MRVLNHWWGAETCVRLGWKKLPQAGSPVAFRGKTRTIQGLCRDCAGIVHRLCMGRAWVACLTGRNYNVCHSFFVFFCSCASTWPINSNPRWKKNACGLSPSCQRESRHLSGRNRANQRGSTDLSLVPG